MGGAASRAVAIVTGVGVGVGVGAGMGMGMGMGVGAIDVVVDFASSELLCVYMIS